MVLSLSEPTTCHFASDWAANALTVVLMFGLFASYIPQHFRIIRAGTSIGFSPWFLLLGSTSSAAAMLNIITMQGPVLRCCLEVSFGKCVEITSGVLQVGSQWFLFSMILVLYMVYYPLNHKYVELEIDTHDSRPVQRVRSDIKSDEWRLSVIVSWAVAIHLAFITFTTFFLLFTTGPLPDPSGPRPHQIELWAAFLGISSGILAAIQYAPQLQRTYRLKLVGALSIPMMVIQSPGGVVMAISIAMRPGTDWTSWVMYAVSAVMQACLLLMCLMWKIRQRRLHIDDFGRPLGQPPSPGSPGAQSILPAESDDEEFEDHVDVRVVEESGEAGEDTPLLKPLDRVTHKGGILGWLERLRS
ncbi:hypothetical protein M404DRAFT_1002150 [Pisolithus tinctorius Marx 270]|uniref:Uncharacterized protein n=1 Tax=Pisolithus tinctorius Marx 270 TaxID=870435 RepID=A0A0C3P4Y6_PISTI|nr:hypothetical protein M404DRAFT_1002150 [Pisolithus tinctorius Marx 270]